jgi:hypothetical protein
MDLCAWPSWSCVEVKPIQASTIHMPAVGKNEDCLSWSRLARNACLERQPARGFAEDSIWFLGSKKQTIQISIHKYIIHKYAYVYIYIHIYTWVHIYIYIWRFVKMSVPGFVDKSQFHACRLMFAFKKHDLPWWRENVEILRYVWKSF